MLEERRNFRRHKQMNFTLRKVFTKRAERWSHQHGVAEVFELQREDFWGLDVHAVKSLPSAIVIMV